MINEERRLFIQINDFSVCVISLRDAGSGHYYKSCDDLLSATRCKQADALGRLKNEINLCISLSSFFFFFSPALFPAGLFLSLFLPMKQTNTFPK